MNTMEFERSYLYNLEAETSVLGSIMYEPDLIHDCSSKPEHFTPGVHQNIFRTMRDLQAKGRPIDIVTLMERVGQNHIEKLGGLAFLTELATNIVSTANFKVHCQVLLEYYQKRSLLNILNTSMESLRELEPNDLIQEISRSVEEIQKEGLTSEDNGDVTEALIELYDEIEKAGDQPPGILTGLRDLDRLIGGYNGGDFVIVAARPSVGKTAFAINIAKNIAQRSYDGADEAVAIFSLEMSKKELLKRTISNVGNIDSNNIKYAGTQFRSEDWRAFSMASGMIAGSGIKMFDKPGMTLQDIRNQCRNLRKDNPTKKIAIIIDYLQLIQLPHNIENRRVGIGEVSRGLKLMAREYNIVVIALSQLSRSVESRQDKRPMMSDLRETGDLEQDADIIQFLYRDDYYDKETENKNLVEVIVAKQRNGATGNVSLVYVKEFSKFVNIDWGQNQALV